VLSIHISVGAASQRHAKRAAMAEGHQSAWNALPRCLPGRPAPADNRAAYLSPQANTPLEFALNSQLSAKTLCANAVPCTRVRKICPLLALSR
jgi:hypothetical protein